MERKTMRTLWFLGTLLAASFVNQVNCESTVEVGGGASATGGGSTSSTTSSSTAQTTTITTSGQEKSSPPPSPPSSPSPSPVPAPADAPAPVPSPSPSPSPAPAPAPAPAPSPSASASTSSASAVAVSSGGGTTSTYTSTSETGDGVATAVSQTTASSSDAPADTEAEDSGSSDLEDDMEMPSADEEISSRSGDDLDIADEVGTEKETFEPSKLPVCEGIPKFRCCDDQDFISKDGKKYCGCWGNDSIEGCDYELDETASPIVVTDLRALFGDGRCRCQEPDEVVYDECFGRTKVSCCDTIEENADKCRCLFGTDRCIYEKGKNGEWKNTLFSSGDCVCPKS